MTYKDPSYQDRIASAADAKKKALDRLRSKPKPDPAILAERQAARLARESAEAEKRAAKKAADEQKAIARAAAEAEAAPAVLTDAERKAARDARYAARKKRK